jgi:uncharacterized protein with gpF-like domain
MARKKRSRAAPRGRAGLVERTFDEVKSSLEALRQLMDGYLPAGKARSKVAAKRRARRKSSRTPVTGRNVAGRPRRRTAKATRA